MCSNGRVKRLLSAISYRSAMYIWIIKSKIILWSAQTGLYFLIFNLFRILGGGGFPMIIQYYDNMKIIKVH